MTNPNQPLSDLDNSFICFNNLISISKISKEEKDCQKTSKYIMRYDNSSDILSFKQISNSKYDYLNICDSFFYIRDIEESKVIYGKKKKEEENSEFFSKETHFSKKDQINQSTQFLLQHMLSNKFISCVMNNKNNKINLQLINEIENAYPFTLQKINKMRLSKFHLKYNQMFYLNIFVKEDNTNYYVNEDEEEEQGKDNNNNNTIDNILNKNENENEYTYIVINSNSMSRYYLVNQSYILNHGNNIYSGHLINIIFSDIRSEKEKKMMLCVKSKKNTSKNLNKKKSYIEIEDDPDDIIINDKFEVSIYEYTDDLCEQITNNALWVIEDEKLYFREGLNISHINIEKKYRIRNALTGLYLAVKQKNLKFFVIKNIISSTIFLGSEKYFYEFCLVDNISMDKNLFFPYNFMFCNYIINDNNINNITVIENGKYILKGVFQNICKNSVFDAEIRRNKFYFTNLERYFLPISIMQDKKNNISVKNEGDFVFRVRQLDALKISEVLYVRKIILKLKKEVKNDIIDLDALNNSIVFLMEYLINIDYSFKDKNQDKNVPIKERQKLLWKFDIVNIISYFIDYIQLRINNSKNKNKLGKKMEILLERVKSLFNYLSKGDQDIKISIYVLALNKIIALEENLYSDCSKLVHFIFDLLHHSEILQTYLLGESTLLKKYIKKTPYLSKMNININNLLQEKKLFKLIENNQNFLLSYQNLLILNKVKYKREEIIVHIKEHIEQIRSNTEKEKDKKNKKKNYFQIIDDGFNDIKNLIKKYVRLLHNLSDPNIVIKPKMRQSLNVGQLFILPSVLRLKEKNEEKKGLNKKKMPKSLLTKSIKEIQIKEDEDEDEIIKEIPELYEVKEVETQKEEKEDENDSFNDINKKTQKDTFHHLLTTESIGIKIKSSQISKDSERQNLIKDKTNKNNNENRRKSFNANITNTKNFKEYNLDNNALNDKNKLKMRKSANIRYNKEQENKLLYENILNKLGKIWVFLKWYETFGLEDLNIEKMFISDNIFKKIFDEKINLDDKKLYYFIDPQKHPQKSLKNLRINISSNFAILYFFRLFNYIFQKNQSKLEEKIIKIESQNSHEKITAKDILEDMGEENIEECLKLKEEEYTLFNKFKDDWKNEKKKIDDKIDEKLGIIYSTYQFYINQYVFAVHKLLDNLSNSFINQESYESIENIKICFLKILKFLLSKVIFLNDNSISFLYSKAINNPTILSGVFNYKELIENYKKNNIKTGINNFERILIDYLYSMCKECDGIRLWYEKINVLKYIRNLVFNINNKDKRNKKKQQQNNNNCKDDNNNNNMYNEIIKNQMVKILNLIWEKKRIPILLIYEEFNSKKNIITEEEKEELEEYDNNNNNNNLDNLEQDQTDFRENDFYVAFKVGEIANFTLKLLNLYEIDEFFGNILYIDCDDYFSVQEDYSIERIKLLKSLTLKIEKEILKLRIYAYKYNDDEYEKYNKYVENFILNRFEYLNHLLGKIKTENLDIFNFDLYIFNTKNILYRMLLNENKTFYKKMEFLSSLEKIFRAIDYSKGDKDNNILGFVSNILRIFLKIIKGYPNFNLIDEQNFKLYNDLIINSLKCINDVKYESIDLKTENIFLEIIYRAFDMFFYIIKISNMEFEKIKEFMENVFLEIQKILNQFKTKKNKYIYRILYLLGLCRILLYLYNDNTYDYFSYKKFYKKIFKLSEIDKFFYNNENENIKEKEKKFKPNFARLVTIREEKSIKDSSNLSTVREKDEKDKSFDINFFPDEMIPLKLNQEKDNEEKEESEEKEENKENDISFDSNFLYTKEENKNYNEESYELNKDLIEDYENEEIEKLSFYVSFLLVYSLYLNEKNSMNKDIKEGEKTDEMEEGQLSGELSLDILLKKINIFLYIKKKYDNNGFNLPGSNNNNNISIVSSLSKVNIPDKTKNNIDSIMNETCEVDETLKMMNPENIIPENNSVDPQNLFIFSLLQSVQNFQNSYHNNVIEIPIKHFVTEEKCEEENDMEEENKSLNETELLNNKEKNNDILFYYYQSSHIDIIILEKILIEISLKTNLKNFCLDEKKYFIESELFKDLRKNLTYFKVIYDYDIKEYDLVNNHFVKNNLMFLIKKIVNTFQYEDMKEISPMNNFMFKRMGEVYNHELNKSKEFEEQENFNLIEFLQFQDEMNIEKSNNINVINFLESLIYIYPKYDKKICLILFKIGFRLLYNLFKNKEENEEILSSNINIGRIIKVIKTLFNRESYKILIEDIYAFNIMLLGLGQLFNSIIDKSSFFLKHYDMIKELLNSCNFIFGYLPEEFFKIVKFMRRPENLVDDYKFRQNKKKLENILEFLLILMHFKMIFEEKILTEKIKETSREIIKLCIKLLSAFLEIPKDKSIEMMNILLGFFFEIIKGPDIMNLNLLFSLGFFDLISFTITNVDYYKLFLNYINKEDLHIIINNFIKIECKIIKIFIAYYNISFYPKCDINEFNKLLEWYENNFKNIEKKLKKIFYISQKEMEGKEYHINDMLLFIKNDDTYTEEEMRKRVGITFTEKNNINSNNEQKICDNNNENNNNNNINENNNGMNNNNKDNKNDNNSKNDIYIDNNGNKKSINHRDFCIIKFDLLLSYYTLFNYHKDLSSKANKDNFSARKSKNFILQILITMIKFFYDFIMFIYNLIKVVILMVYYFSKRFLPKIKSDVELLQDLQDIETKAENIKSEKIIYFLQNYIREVEVSIKNIIFKVYFPMTDRANTLLKYRKEYLKVDKIDSSDFINYLLSQYDYINIRAKQNALVNKYIDEFPILNYIFKNIYIYGVLILFLGLGSNFLILSSFNTFTTGGERECGRDLVNFKYTRLDRRIQCPRFMYSFNYDPVSVIITLIIFILVQCILQGLTFLDYTIRTIFVESEIVKFNYNSEYLKTNLKYHQGMNLKYFLCIFFPTFFRCIFNFQTLYYIISITFLILSIVIHPFYNCVILLEFVNRVEVMQNILKAMYRPAKNIFIILLMFIILEYFFSIFASSWFTYHFPNITDTSNFLKIFMRMMDQTFKQDGGIGTYLDKELDPVYSAHHISGMFISRFLFDLLFFLVVLLLILQMFLSVIIDYFNETREKSENFSDAMETQCLVCGIDREKIEKINPNDKHAFERHITYSHNVFNYLYYLMYLQSLDFRDVIIDNSVWNLHLVKNLSYLPKNEFFKNLEKQRLEAKKNE